MAQSISRPMIQINSPGYRFPDPIEEMVKRQVGYGTRFKSTEKKKKTIRVISEKVYS